MLTRFIPDVAGGVAAFIPSLSCATFPSKDWPSDVPVAPEMHEDLNSFRSVGFSLNNGQTQWEIGLNESHRSLHALMRRRNQNSYQVFQKL